MTSKEGETDIAAASNGTIGAAGPLDDEMSHQDKNHQGGDSAIEKKSFSTLKNIQEELRESLSYCQTMLS